MGIHIHRAGCPPQDMCGCCDLRTRLDALYDRTHNAILSINGQTPDGQGAITLELLEQAAVQSIIDDHIDPLRETVDGLSITVESWNPLFEDYVHILRKVDIDLPDLITANHQYTAAVADDLLQNHYTKTQADGRFALQSELDTYAKDSDLVAALDAMVRRSGNSTPQVITGTGGLMLQGDLSVGGDITGSSDTYLHFDTVRQMELAGMTVRKDGAITRLANSNGLSINGLYMSDMVSTIKTELQTLRGPLAGPDATDSSPSSVYVTKANVMSTNGKVNNIVHTIGDETINGTKDFASPIKGEFDHFIAGPSSRWKRLYTRTNNNLVQSFMFVGGQTIGFALIGDGIRTHIMSSSSRPYNQPIFKLCTGANGEVSVHMKGSYSAATHIYLINNFRYSTNYAKDYGIRIDNIEEDEPVLGEEYIVVSNSQDFDVIR